MKEKKEKVLSEESQNGRRHIEEDLEQLLDDDSDDVPFVKASLKNVPDEQFESPSKKRVIFKDDSAQKQSLKMDILLNLDMEKLNLDREDLQGDEDAETTTAKKKKKKNKKKKSTAKKED